MLAISSPQQYLDRHKRQRARYVRAVHRRLSVRYVAPTMRQCRCQLLGQRPDMLRGKPPPVWLRLPKEQPRPKHPGLVPKLPYAVANPSLRAVSVTILLRSQLSGPPALVQQYGPDEMLDGCPVGLPVQHLRHRPYPARFRWDPASQTHVGYDPDRVEKHVRQRLRRVDGAALVCRFRSLPAPSRMVEYPTAESAAIRFVRRAKIPIRIQITPHHGILVKRCDAKFPAVPAGSWCAANQTRRK